MLMKKEKNIAPIFRRFMAAFVDTSYILLLYFGLNIVGKNIKAEFPKNSDIIIKNRFDKPIHLLKKELINKIKKFN